MSAYQEFTGKSVEEALKAAREAFKVELNDLDFEILTPGSRGVLGMGAESARIVAARDRPADDRPARRAPASDLTEREAAEVAAARGSVAAERADLEAADASPEALAAGKDILENLMRLM